MVYLLFFSHSHVDVSASFNFIREPSNPTYFAVNESVQLVWEYNPQNETPSSINFGKYDNASSVYDSIADKFPKQTFIYIYQSRIDVVGLATLRFNNSQLNDAGIYRCKIKNGSDVVSSVITLRVRGK